MKIEGSMINNYNIEKHFDDEEKFIKIEIWDNDWEYNMMTLFENCSDEMLRNVLWAYEKGERNGEKLGRARLQLELKNLLEK
jgi:hypothetical protein